MNYKYLLELFRVVRIEMNSESQDVWMLDKKFKARSHRTLQTSASVSTNWVQWSSLFQDIHEQKHRGDRKFFSFGTAQETLQVEKNFFCFSNERSDF